MAEIETLSFQNADASKINFLSKEDSGASETTTTTTENKGTDTAPNETATEGASATNTTGAVEGTQTTKEGDDTTSEGQQTTITNQESEYTEEQFHEDVDTFVRESTGGAVSRVSDISAILEENKKLKAELQGGYKFPNEAAKKVYELATKVAGSELGTARKLLHALSLDVSTMTPKEKQFEAFVLDRPTLSREDARKRFEALYEKKYNDLENDLLQLDDHEQATRDAEAKISAHVGDLEKSVKQSGESTQDGPTPEQVSNWHSRLESALTSFGGVTLKFDDGQYGKLNVAMDRSKASEFMEVLKNPHSLIDQIAATCQNENDFIREMYMLFDRSRISKEERDHLMKLGKVAQIQAAKNTGKKDLKEETTTTTKPTFQQAMSGAVKAAGLA